MKLLSVARLPAAINRKLRALALADAQAALRNAGLTLASLTATMEAACEELTLDSFARCLQRNNEQALAALALKGELDYAEWREGLQKWLRMLNTGEKTGASMGWGALHTAAKDTLRQNKIRAMQQAGLVTRPRGARS
jgi:Tfp pilus assembly protein PilX